MTEFNQLGKRCNARGCSQQDFLPFTCDACERVFCLNHRSYEAHDCPHGWSSSDVRVFLCPICNKSIKIRYGEDINITWNRHADHECKGAPPPKKKKKEVNFNVHLLLKRKIVVSHFFRLRITTHYLSTSQSNIIYVCRLVFK